MPEPATTGRLCTRIGDMEIGDYIVCKYIAANNRVGTFNELGRSHAPEISIEGNAAPDGSFYFVMVDKSKHGGLLVADRVVQVGINWDVLNAGLVIQGKLQTFDKVEGIIRSLTGGCAYANENGHSSLTDKGFGAWPPNNEWDKYIVQFPEEFIQKEKTLDDVFHWSGALSWCQETPVNGLVYVDGGGNNVVGVNSRRVRRGWRQLDTLSHGQSSSMDKNIGFRPVFEYREMR